MRTPPNERLTPDIAETDSPRASGGERRCILSGQSAARDDLLRLAISPEGDVLSDPGAKAPGRGAWITPDRQALEQAVKDGHLEKALSRAFKGAALKVPADLPDSIELGLTRSLTNRLGLELRAGNVVMGSSKIADQARGGVLALLLHASDSSEDGRKKLDQAWRVGRMIEGSGERGTVLPLDRAALSVALGRDNVVHLGVVGSRQNTQAAWRIGREVQRLLGYCGQSNAENSAGVLPDADHEIVLDDQN